jgi:hypothetical protein
MNKSRLLSQGVGTILLIASVPGWPGPMLMTLGSAGLLTIFVVIIRQQLALYTVTISCQTGNPN